jgi:hypothetical protein
MISEVDLENNNYSCKGDREQSKGAGVPTLANSILTNISQAVMISTVKEFPGHLRRILKTTAATLTLTAVLSGCAFAKSPEQVVCETNGGFYKSFDIDESYCFGETTYNGLTKGPVVGKIWSGDSVASGSFFVVDGDKACTIEHVPQEIFKRGFLVRLGLPGRTAKITGEFTPAGSRHSFEEKILCAPIEIQGTPVEKIPLRPFDTINLPALVQVITPATRSEKEIEFCGVPSKLKSTLPDNFIFCLFEDIDKKVQSGKSGSAVYDPRTNAFVGVIQANLRKSVIIPETNLKLKRAGVMTAME